MSASTTTEGGAGSGAPDAPLPARATTPPAVVVAPRVSVVIPAHNAEGSLGRQLVALAREHEREPFHLIVVDDGSTDRTAEVARSFESALPGLRVLIGLGGSANAARNLGLWQVTTPYVLFCDADDEVAPGWVTALADGMVRGADAVTGVLDEVSLNSPETLRLSARHSDTLVQVAGFLPRALGASLGVRTDAARAVGGFDESYVWGAQDTEFCWRLQLAGFSMALVPEAVVRYRLRTSYRAHAGKAYRLGVARAQLYRDFGGDGMPRSNPAAAVARTGRLVVSAPWAALDRRRRAAWLRESAAAAGRARGSLRYRVLYL